VDIATLWDTTTLFSCPSDFFPQGFVSLTLYYSCVFAYIRARTASIILLLEPASAVVLAAIIMRQQIASSVLVAVG
jgi:hypothetical protein